MLINYFGLLISASGVIICMFNDWKLLGLLNFTFVVANWLAIYLERKNDRS